jgi:hypothetical protein
MSSSCREGTRGTDTAKRSLGPAPRIAAAQALDEERMTGCSSPGPQGGPAAVISPGEEVGRGVVGAADPLL